MGHVNDGRDDTPDNAPGEDRPDESTPAESTPEESTAEASAPEIGPEPRQLSPALIATLITIPVMVLVGFIAYAALRPDYQSPLHALAAPDSGTEECSRLMDALPPTFEGFDDKEIGEAGLVTWPATDGGAPLVLRCGVERPEGLAPTSSLQVVFPAQWFITETDEERGQAYVSVAHRPYVALWTPLNTGNAPITDISAIIDAELEPGPLELG